MYGCRGWGEYEQAGVRLRAPIFGFTSSATSTASENVDGSSASADANPLATSERQLETDLAPYVTSECSHDPQPLFAVVYLVCYISLTSYLSEHCSSFVTQPRRTRLLHTYYYACYHYMSLIRCR